MKTKSLLFACLGTLFPAWADAQVYATSSMDLNNASFRICTNGVLFHNFGGQQHGYFVPKNDGTAIIYSGAFWFGGYDAGGGLHLAGMIYGQTGNDFRPGPFSTSMSYDSSEYMNKYGTSIWTVDQSEVENHIQSWATPGYIIPQNILNWPGNGDAGLGVAQQLAPYMDLNGNGLYDPGNGDYPLIKGCQARYMILNDDRVHTESVGAAISMEVHLMFYQFEGENPYALSNTTFVDVRAINRGNVIIQDFRAGFFIDGDLGNYADDYAGCDTSRNMGYTYNADNLDENNAGLLGYGVDPPAFGVISLNRPLSSFAVMSGSTPGQDVPANAAGYYGYMGGYWPNGTDFLDNQGQTTKFMYHENPWDTGSFSEMQMSNVSGDRRMLLSHDLDVFQPGSVQELSYAIVYNRSGDLLGNLQDLMLVADSVKEFYLTGSPYCSSASLGLTEAQVQSEWRLYPNPAGEKFTMYIPDGESGMLIIHALSGDEVLSAEYTGGVQDVDVSNLSEGIYFVEARSTFGSKVSKLTVSR